MTAALERAGVWAAEIPAAATVEPFLARCRALRRDDEPLLSVVRHLSISDPPEHPCIAFNARELERMRERIENHTWAREAWEGVKANADKWLDRGEGPPSKPGGWSHDYACVHCGAPLRYREDHPHEHICRKCGKITRGEKQDATWRGIKHGHLVRAARDMGLAWQITRQKSYAREAIRILKWYADHYVDFPVQTRHGKVHWQSLTESSWLTGVVEAADLVYNAMTEDEKRAVETDLVRAGAEHVAAQPCGYSNWRCWYNACLGTAGYFLGDADLVSRARDGEGGFKYMIDKGVLEDGLWYERSIGYHNYSLSALIRHAQADRHAGGDLWQYGRLPLMFTAELRLTFPNLVSPSLNDMGYRSKRIGTRYLTYGWAWYKDPVAGGALNLLHAKGASRSRLEDWHVSEPVPEEIAYSRPASQDMPGVGLLVLRRGAGPDSLCAMLEYGEHGGGHGHPDKLQLLFYGLGRPLCPDLGTVRYGNPLYHQWYKTTPGHNTVTIGGRSMGRVKGERVAFVNADQCSAAVVRTTRAYPGYVLTRRLLLADRFLVDVFDVQGGKADVIDWFLRVPGELVLSVAVEPIDEEPLSAPYKHLRGLQAARGDHAWQAVWTLPDARGRLALDIAGVPDTEMSQSKAPGIPGELWNTLRIRRRAANTRFAAVYQAIAPGSQSEPVVFDEATVCVGNFVVTIRSGDACPVVRNR